MKNWKKLLTLSAATLFTASLTNAAVLIEFGDNAGKAFENTIKNGNGDLDLPFSIAGINGNDASLSTDGATGSLADAGITFDIEFSINAGNTDIGVAGQNIGVDDSVINGSAEILTLSFANVTGLTAGRDLKFVTIRHRNASSSEQLVINGITYDAPGGNNIYLNPDISYGDDLVLSAVDGSGWSLRSVTIEVVSAPEPSSLALLGFGALFLAKRKRKLA